MTHPPKHALQSVLMVSSQYPPVYGGAGAQAALLGRTLARRGWDVHVVTLDQHRAGSDVSDGIHVHRSWRTLPTTRITRLLSSLMLSLAASGHIFRKRPSIVHVHGIYWWTILPVVIGRILGCRTLIKSTRDGEDDPRTVIDRRIGRIPIGWLYGLSLRLAHGIVVLNDVALQSSVSAGFEAKTHLMKNGVDSEALLRDPKRRDAARDDFKLRPNDLVIAFVGYLVKHKGVLDLLEAAQQLNQPNLQLWLVGPSTGFYRELTDDVGLALQAARSAGLDVRELGLVPHELMPRIYWACDVFSLPSYVEGMPNSLAEAIAGGAKVAATKIPGITDLFNEEDTIELVEPGDVDSLKNYLRYLIKGGEQDVSRAAERISIAVVCDSYERLYSELGSK